MSGMMMGRGHRGRGEVPRGSARWQPDSTAKVQRAPPTAAAQMRTRELPDFA